VRAAAIALLLVIVASFAFADNPQNPNNVAQGAEKAASKAARPDEPEGGPTEGSRFLGLPAWIWKLLNMLAFLAFLVWALRGPVNNAIASRHDQIQRESIEARERRTKADQMARDIQARLARLEEDVRQIRERARTEGERQKREMIAAAEAEAQKILQGAKNEVDNRLKNARHELTEYAGQLASDRAEKLLRDKVTDADREKLFQESLSEVEEASS
jgi:F-type H+-transporting ATPase subunit b